MRVFTLTVTVLFFTTIIMGCVREPESISRPEPEGLTIGIDPGRLTVSNGVNFMLAVWVDVVTELFGASFELSYDSTKIEADSAAVGDFLGSDVIFFDHYEPGVVSIAVTRKAGAGGVDGYGTLARVHFHAVGTGTTAVEFTPDVALIKEDGAPVDSFDFLDKWSTSIKIQ